MTGKISQILLKKRKNMNEGKVLKAGIWYTIANFFTKGAVFLTMPLFTRIMSIDDIGIYSNITTWADIFLIITTFEFATSLIVARFDYEMELDNYISSILIYGSVVSTFFYFIFLLNFNYFSTFFTIPNYCLHIVMIYMVVAPALQIYQNMCRYKYNYKGVIVSSVGVLMVATIFSLICTYLSENQLMGRVLGFYIPYIIASIILYIYHMKKGRRCNVKYLQYALSLSVPMIGHLLAGQLLNASDKIIITKYIGADANALYSVAYTCAMVMTVLLASMNNAWAPWSIECMKNNKIDLLKQATKSYAVFFSIIAVFFLLVAPELLYLMGGELYMEAKYVIPPIVAGYVCQFFYTLYVNAEFYLKKQKMIAVGTICAAMLNVILNILLVPRYGYIMAAYTTLFGYFCLVLFHCCSIKVLKKSEWFNNKFYWKIISLCLVSVPIMNLLYSHFLIRYAVLSILICLSAMVIYHNKTYVREIFKMIIK